MPQTSCPLRALTRSGAASGEFVYWNGSAWVPAVDLIKFNNTDFNVHIGYQAGKNVVSGATKNTYVGYQSGYSSVSTTDAAFFNVGVGYKTLYATTTGFQNTAVGACALESNTTGNNNTAVGGDAMKATTTGTHNTATGEDAMRENTTGSGNSANSVDSLYSNTTGIQNTAAGRAAMFWNTTGSNNCAYGVRALQNNTTGSQNIAIGPVALYDLIITDGTLAYNIGIGYYAGQGLVTGVNNTFLGSNITVTDPATSNTIIVSDGTGSHHIRVNASGINRFLYNYAASGSDGYNTFLGANAGNRTMSPGAGASLLASYNTIVGAAAFQANTTGAFNTAHGYGSLQASTTASNNTALGAQTLQNNTTGGSNTAVGSAALFTNVTGTNNTAVGESALRFCTVNNNTAFGQAALRNSTTGSFNTSLGQSSLISHLTGSNNTAVGFQAGYNSGVTLQTNAQCVFLGSDANSSIDGVSNSIAIGYTAQVTKSNQVVLGNSSITETVLRGSVLSEDHTITKSQATAPLKVYNTSTSGHFTGYFQNTQSASQASLYIENDRGGFASYGGWLYGGSATGLGNLFGVNRQDKLFVIADGANNLGMYIGTLQTQPVSICTGNTVRLTISGAGAFTFAGSISSQNIEPVTDNTYYLGRNDDDSPKAYKGVILKDTTDGKYYRVEVISGVVTATDLTD